MNFLQIAQKAREKCRIPGTGPSAVTAQTGEMLRLVNWVIETWDQLQIKSEHWKWMRGDFTLATAAGTNAYLPATAGITAFARWHEDTFRVYKTSVGQSEETFLPYWDYDVFRNTYLFGSQATLQGRPVVWTERPSDQAILLANTPDDIYTVSGQYQKAPTSLAADADTPGMPARFHMLIVYGVMMKYGAAEAAPEIRVEGENEWDKMLAQLESSQLPAISFGDPLA